MASFLRLLIVLATSLAIGSLLGYLAGYYSTFEQILRPVMMVLTSFPTICIILVLLVFTKLTAYIVVILVAMPVIYESTLQGTKLVKRRYRDDLSLSDAREISKLIQIITPLASPYLLVGLLQASGLGLKVLIMAEILSGSSSSKGIGNLINISYISSDYPTMFAYSFLAVIIILMIDLLLRFTKEKIEKELADYR